MIGPTFPYIKVEDLEWKWIALHPFGLLVAIGVMVGTWLARRRARLRGLDLDELDAFITWMLVVGFFGSHVLDVVFYHPKTLLEDPLDLVKPWKSLSSFGGFLSGLFGVLLWKYVDAQPWIQTPLGAIPRFRRRAKALPLLPFCDVILAVFPVAWIFGRMGCTTAHDHPGMRTLPGTPFSVDYPALGESPPGTHFGPVAFLHGSAPRYDLGLLEMLFTVVLAGLFALTWRRKLPTGTYVVAVVLAYAPVRTAMDFLRIKDGESADPRYGGLTPAQWGSIGILLFALALWRRVAVLEKRGIDPLDELLAKPSVDEAPERA